MDYESDVCFFPVRGNQICSTVIVGQPHEVSSRWCAVCLFSALSVCALSRRVQRALLILGME